MASDPKNCEDCKGNGINVKHGDKLTCPSKDPKGYPKVAAGGKK